VPTAFSEGVWAGRGKGNSCPWDGIPSLKVDEPQVSQRHKDMENKQEYYHIIIFPEKT
jgi:hypothetical protein